MLMRGLTLLGAVAAASAESYSSDFLATVVHRGLQAEDSSICSTTRTVLTDQTGTLSDDQTDGAVDCSAGGCGGADTGSNGYGDNLDCGKHIAAPAGTTIALTFTHLALEQSAGCPEPGCDTVTVYDGSSASSPVLGTYSGTTVPRPVRSTGSDIFVRFQTDTGNAGLSNMPDDPGFYIDWHFVQNVVDTGAGICGAPASLTDAHGTLHDEDGDTGTVDCTTQNCGSTDNAGYADNQNCYTTITAPAGDFVRFTFTQMNLEGPGQKPGCQPCADPRGCDYVALYDGTDEQAPLIGTYSGHHLGWNAAGGGEDYLPSVVTTGSSLHIRFLTDTHNCGIDASEDPGWIADWDFIENGQDICHPDAGVMTDPGGVLHDDAPARVNCQNGGCGTTGDSAATGYGDNLDCGVRIRAPKGSTINLHFTQMNLEAGTANYAGDYIEIYDGRNEHGTVLAHVTGDVTDDRIQRDTFTSTGRDVFVRFVTDGGNVGLSGTTTDPGFWLEWQFIAGGADCMQYSVIQGRGIVGHNNENFPSRTAAECEQLCCDRDWCRSFDFLGSPTDGTGSCSLADVDVTNNQATNTEYNSDIYERVHDATIGAIEGAAGCAAQLTAQSANINALCCPPGGCERGTPDECTEECDTIWTPFAKRCSLWLQANQASSGLNAVTTLCEDEEYGRFSSLAAANSHGRCGNGDLAQWIQELAPACCGDGGDPGTAASPHCKTPATELGLGTPVFLADTCTPQCADMFEEMYAECHPRFESVGLADTMRQILASCQGVPDPGPAPAGGGHRRLGSADGSPVMVPSALPVALAAADLGFA